MYSMFKVETDIETCFWVVGDEVGKIGNIPVWPFQPSRFRYVDAAFPQRGDLGHVE